MNGVDSEWDYDVAVIGGGPGGSSVATALARRGRSVVVVERERFPRFHIGESQLPWTNEILYYHAVVSVLAGNWRPSLATRARVEAFFAVVAVKRILRRFGRPRRVPSSDSAAR